MPEVVCQLTVQVTDAAGKTVPFSIALSHSRICAFEAILAGCKIEAGPIDPVKLRRIDRLQPRCCNSRSKLSCQACQIEIGEILDERVLVVVVDVVQDNDRKIGRIPKRTAEH